MNEKIKWFLIGLSIGVVVSIVPAALRFDRDQGEIADAKKLAANLGKRQQIIDEGYRKLARSNSELGKSLADARGYVERIAGRLESGAGDFGAAIRLVDEIAADIESLEMVLNREPAGGGGDNGVYNLPP
jgi:hypothetical protein